MRFSNFGFDLPMKSLNVEKFRSHSRDFIIRTEFGSSCFVQSLHKITFEKYARKKAGIMASHTVPMARETFQMNCAAKILSKLRQPI